MKIILLANTTLWATAHLLFICLRAYVPTLAYVENGMSMRLLRQEENRLHRVLARNMAFPMITNSPLAYFLGNLKVTRSNPCGQPNQQLHLTLVLLFLHRSVT